MREKKNERLEIRIGPVLKELADDVAREVYNMSLSELVRDFLDKEVTKHQRKKEKMKK